MDKSVVAIRIINRMNNDIVNKDKKGHIGLPLCKPNANGNS